MRIAAIMNGSPIEGDVPPELLAVDWIRDRLGLTGTHIGCDTSQCGACTILFEGASVKSCTMLAVSLDGHSVTTIEGLRGVDGGLHPMQEAFHQNHGLQCGFCTPGMILRAVDLANENRALTEAGVRRELEGNICRCTGYQNIVASVLAGATAMHASAKGE